MRKPYPIAIRVLLKHLQRPYSNRTKEGIARALAVPEAGDGWDIVLEEFEKDPDTVGNGPKYGLGCALSVIARTTNRIDEALSLLRDEKHGVNRLALLTHLPLAKTLK